jgi:hypothetical protein
MKTGIFRATFIVKYDSKRELKPEEVLLIKKSVDSLVEALVLQDRVLFSFEDVPLKDLIIFSEDNLNKLLSIK